MRISDWSSDVCSSDLPEGDVGGAAGGVDAQLLAQLADDGEGLAAGGAQGADRHDQRVDHDVLLGDAVVGGALADLLGEGVAPYGVHRDDGDRMSVVWGRSGSGRGEIGGRRQLKTTNN